MVYVTATSARVPTVTHLYSIYGLKKSLQGNQAKGKKKNTEEEGEEKEEEKREMMMSVMIMGVWGKRGQEMRDGRIY